MDTLDRIKELDSLSESGFEEVQKRRSTWEIAVNEVLVPTLKEVKTILEKADKRRNIYISKNGEGSNFGTVQFNFGNIPSGVSDENGHGVENGATLVFSQTDLGIVSILAYPFKHVFVGEDRSNTRPSWYKKRFYSPDEISREDVLLIFESFYRWAMKSSIFCPRDIMEEKDSEDWKN